MSCTRSKIVSQARAWVGLKEFDGSHKKIIDIYNSHKPLARGYKLKYTDEWCAGTVSALAIACGATDIIPTEVSCGQFMKLLMDRGIWVEADNYVPLPGDIILYDWEDDGTGDNKGNPNHIGIVEDVADKVINVIEGNYGNAVARRAIKVNNRYIRGYGVPKYDKESVKLNKETAKDAARFFLNTLAGTYTVTAQSGLNVRHGAGTAKKKMVAIPKDTAVRCYGYYTNYLGTKWLYIQFIYKDTQYTGFASSKYLKKL